MQEGRRERSLRTRGRIADSNFFPNLVVDTINGTPVRLSDLGEVVDSTKEVRTLGATQRPTCGDPSGPKAVGENTVKVIEAIHSVAALREVASRRCPSHSHPRPITLTSSRPCMRIEGHLISGSILACLTVLIFMRSWRSTLIASVAISASIVATFCLHESLRVYAQQCNHVGLGAHGGGGYRRRHRRA